jgi:hypothetical protein
MPEVSNNTPARSERGAVASTVLVVQLPSAAIFRSAGVVLNRASADGLVAQERRQIVRGSSTFLGLSFALTV